MIFKLAIIFSPIILLSSSEINYKGESFPLKYIKAEDVVPEYSDVEYYLQGLNKMLGYIERYANETGVNRALGIFYMKAILKRTIMDHKNKIRDDERKLMNTVILRADNIMSHFYYNNTINPTSWADIIKRVAELFRDEDLQIEAIGNFNRNRLRQWLFIDLHFNDLARDMDEMSLPKEQYVMYSEKSMNSDEYSMSIDDSDYCMGEIIYNPKPHVPTNNLQPCVYDDFCSGIVYERSLSIAYSLSHRMLNVMFPRHIRRCYMSSPEEDDELVDILCSSMYRETVYIARRGYFSRDIWMEHIALCSMHGYEEFHRRHWFRKVVSWIDEQGCIAENFNYDVNRTRYALGNEENPTKKEKIREISRKILADKCHFHPMALGLIVLAHGVRHAVHFSEEDRGQKDAL